MSFSFSRSRSDNKSPSQVMEAAEKAAADNDADDEKKDDGSFFGISLGMSGSRGAADGDETAVSESSAVHKQQPMTTTTSENNNKSKQQQQQTTPSCCKRLGTELNPCQPWFHVLDKATGRKIDIPESFAPNTIYAGVMKFIGMGLLVGTYIYGFIDAPYKNFHMAYLTYWGLLVTCLYTLLSFWNTLRAGRTPQPPDRVGWVIGTTWILYTLAVHTSIMVTLLWWILIYVPGETNITYLAIVPHCVSAVVVWWLGTFVDRIPLRILHYFGFVLPFDILYVIWTAIHSALQIGNPDENDTDPTTNDDAIYDSLAWNSSWQKVLILVVLVVLVAGPIIFVFLWMVSLYNIPCLCLKDRRIYVDSYKDDDNPRPTVNDVEEGSIFAMFK